MRATRIVMSFGKLDEVRQRFDEVSSLRKDIFYLAVCFLIVLGAAMVQNVTTPDDPVNVGLVEVETNCHGFEASDYCIGVQRQSHTTYNYDNYTDPEPGTENFYRKVEAELMGQAYDICDVETEGMEWTDEAEYRNQTGSEWLESDQVELLPCEKTFYRDINATR